MSRRRVTTLASSSLVLVVLTGAAITGTVAGLRDGGDADAATATTVAAAAATTDTVPSPACVGTTYQGFAPAVEGIAFGPDVRPMIANFEGLSPEEQAVAVADVQTKSAWCGYSAMALTGAYHRGIRAWPTADEWLAQLNTINSDRNAQAALVDELVGWEHECVTSVAVVNDPAAYDSDWYDRTSGTPVLVTGPGHDADGRGWVIRRDFKQTDECLGLRKGDPATGKPLDERLGCFFQLAVDFPLPLPPVPETPQPPAPPVESTPPPAPPEVPPPPAPPAPPEDTTPEETVPEDTIPVELCKTGPLAGQPVPENGVCPKYQRANVDNNTSVPANNHGPGTPDTAPASPPVETGTGCPTQGCPEPATPATPAPTTTAAAGSGTSGNGAPLPTGGNTGVNTPEPAGVPSTVATRTGTVAD